MNFAKFAATSLSRKAEAQGFEAVLLPNWNNLLTAREGKTEYQKIRACLLGATRRGIQQVRGADDGKGKSCALACDA